MFSIVILCFVVASANARSRIINGDDAGKTEFPHQVSLRSWNSHSCGGAILSDQWIVTAAHCTQGKNLRQYTVAVNIHDISNVASQNVFRVSNIINHENYKGTVGSDGAFPNDIALIKIDGIIDNAESVRIDIDTRGSIDGSNCVISGWGVDETGGLSNVLQKTDGILLSNSDCTGIWGTNINDRHVCIHREDTGSCNGDSGGPMTCDDGGRKVLSGVTSWGINGCDPAYPSVYTRISKFADWINKNMN